MKRLIILTAVAMLTVASLGCARWSHRGAPCTTYGAAPGDPCMAAPSAAPVIEGGGTYLPAPG